MTLTIVHTSTEICHGIRYHDNGRFTADTADVTDTPMLWNCGHGCTYIASLGQRMQGHNCPTHEPFTKGSDGPFSTPKIKETRR